MSRDEFHPDAHPEATEITGPCDYGEWGQCVAESKQKDRRCHGYALGAHGKCYSHGGKSTGPSPEAAAGNQNAMTTGLHSDPVNLFQYLKDEDPTAATWIIAKLRDYARNVDFEVFVVDVAEYDNNDFDALEMRMTGRGDDLLQTCVRDYARWRATKRQLTEGIISKQEKTTDHGKVEVEDSNPVNLDLDRMDRTVTRMKEKDGLLDSPDQQTADALDGGLELALSTDDKDTLEAAFDTES